jgi:hypothetical protein
LLLLVTTSPVGVAHGLKLLQLIGSEDGGELIFGVLMDRLELLTTLIAAQAGIGAESRHLLLLRGENGLELRCLIVGQVEAFAETLSSFMCVEVVMALSRLIGGLLLRGGIVCGLLSRLLAEGRSGGERECQG